MNFTVFNFSLLNFHSDSFINRLGVRLLDLKSKCQTVVENTPKHTKDDLEIIFFGGACPRTPIEYFLTLRFI